MTQKATAASSETAGGVTFPSDRVMELCLRALGGNFAYYEQQAIQDLNDQGSRSLEYAMSFFAPLLLDGEIAPCVQVAIDIAAKIIDEKRERLAGRFVYCDLPAWMRMPENAHALDDDTMRCSIVNHWFHAALDAQGQGMTEVIIFRQHDDGTKTARRIGVRDVQPSGTVTPPAPGS